MNSNDTLLRAIEIQCDAAKLGFDWPDVHGPLAKVREETLEIEQALAQSDRLSAQKELGDLLFAAVNVARFLDANPVDALNGTVARFQRRFDFVKERVNLEGKDMTRCTLEELDTIWEEAKRSVE